jgi:hypothetical protein
LVGRASLVDRKGIMGEQAVKGIPHAVLRTLDSLARSMMWSNQPRNGRLCFRRGGFWRGGEVDFGKWIGEVGLYLGCVVELRCFALCRGGILLVVQ